MRSLETLDLDCRLRWPSYPVAYRDCQLFTL